MARVPGLAQFYQDRFSIKGIWDPRDEGMCPIVITFCSYIKLSGAFIHLIRLYSSVPIPVGETAPGKLLLPDSILKYEGNWLSYRGTWPYLLRYHTL